MNALGLLKIAVVGQFENLEHWAAWLALAFQKQGHDVRAFDYRRLAAQSDPARMNRQLLRQVRRWDSHLVVVVKGELVQPSVLASLKKDGCWTILLANDDHQVFKEVSLPLGRNCDKVFTFTKGSLPWYGAEGVAAEHMLFYADPEICAPKDMPKFYDASFVGTYYPEREGLVRALSESTLNFGLYGDGWNRSDRSQWLPQGVVQRPDYLDVLRMWHSSLVCLNIHQDGLKKLGVQANLRCYELGAGGCFMVSDHVDGMETVFGSPLPFVTLPDDWSTREKVDHVRMVAGSDQAEYRAEKCDRFRKIVVERHTPEKRAEQILDGLK